VSRLALGAIKTLAEIIRTSGSSYPTFAAGLGWQERAASGGGRPQAPVLGKQPTQPFGGDEEPWLRRVVAVKGGAGIKYLSNLTSNRAGSRPGTKATQTGGRPVLPPVGIRPPTSNSPRKQALTKRRTQFLRSLGKM
jgi:hypothetical protein